MSPDDPAVANIIRRCKVARIATVSRNGRPSVNPLYFIYREGVVWLGTAEWTLAARNVKSNPAVSLLFQAEKDANDKRILRLSGKARVRTDVETVRSYRLRVVGKYILPLGAIRNNLVHFRQIPLQNAYRAQSRKKGQTCVIEVIPDHGEILSDDNLPC